jgi:hypothetical protein
MIEEHASDADVFVFRSQGQMDRYVEALRDGQPAPVPER